jgi:hypothetical protein
MPSIRKTMLAVSALLVGACGRDPVAPPSTTMLGTWHYAMPVQSSGGPSLNAGLQVTLGIASFDGMRFRGRVDLWFTGDMGLSLDNFGPVHGTMADGGAVSFTIPLTHSDGPPISVVGIVTGDLLVVTESQRGLEPGPFVHDGQFRRIQ